MPLTPQYPLSAYRVSGMAEPWEPLPLNYPVALKLRQVKQIPDVGVLLWRRHFNTHLLSLWWDHPITMWKGNRSYRGRASPGFVLGC